MLVQSPGGEDSSSNTDESMGTDGDADEDKGEVAKMETSEKQRIPSEGRHEMNQVDHDHTVEPWQKNRKLETRLFFMMDIKQRMQQEGHAAVFQQHKKHKEPQDRHQKAKLLESLCSENPMLSSLCGTLFPKNNQSVWSGPHSLVHQRNSARTSSIRAAIGSFME
ncbi:hypothetical protein QL285_006343 [Trifolium repens]|nr:hypothetical protein QL285_006343 [Trifolium repens]